MERKKKNDSEREMRKYNNDIEQTKERQKKKDDEGERKRW